MKPVKTKKVSILENEKSDKAGKPAEADIIPISTLIYYKQKGLTHKEIAKLVGCTECNVQRRLKKEDFEDLSRFQENKAVVLSMKQRDALKALTPEKMEEASALQLGTLAGILIDKERLLNGQATTIIESRVITATLDEAIKNLKDAGMLSIDSEVIDV